MSRWKNFLECTELKNTKFEELKAKAAEGFERYGIYSGSLNQVGNALIMMVYDDTQKYLIMIGEDARLANLNGREEIIKGEKIKVCPITNENCRVIRNIFIYTNPQAHKGKKITIGLGDRLGLASTGHIQTVKDLDVFPVLAQQSIRELNLTGRNYEDVLSSAAWAVFQEGYKKGYGADGDHLKTAEEVKMAVDVGMTMITLDCSDHIDNSAAAGEVVELMEKYNRFSSEERVKWEKRYADKKFEIEGFEFFITSDELIRMACVYGKAIQHTLDIYHNLIAKSGREIDFEMSIDETLTSTNPASHYFVSSELINAGVDITSLAPRFCGEFQKGIDYRGDLGQFIREFTVHVAIADYFGYKISVHSGSDKFMVFPIVGEKTKGNYHLKTAGTNWLEALRVVAVKKPDLYRRMHAFALEHLHEARKYYHISAKPENITALDRIKDSELAGLMDKEDSRQVMHITYGLILLAKDKNGKSLFRDELYEVLHKNENEYTEALKKHIGKHLQSLGL